MAILYNLPMCHFRTFKKQKLFQRYSLTSEGMLGTNSLMTVESEEKNIVGKTSKLLLFKSPPPVEDKKKCEK